MPAETHVKWASLQADSDQTSMCQHIYHNFAVPRFMRQHLPILLSDGQKDRQLVAGNALSIMSLFYLATIVCHFFSAESGCSAGYVTDSNTCPCAEVVLLRCFGLCGE